jgi:hypothetical protein
MEKQVPADEYREEKEEKRREENRGVFECTYNKE